MPVPPRLIEAWANRALSRVGWPNEAVSKMWPYRFIERLLAHLDLGPVKQIIEESKRIQADDAGLLAYWYD
jgi:hypothetical protein